MKEVIKIHKNDNVLLAMRHFNKGERLHTHGLTIEASIVSPCVCSRSPLLKWRMARSTLSFLWIFMTSFILLPPFCRSIHVTHASYPAYE